MKSAFKIISAAALLATFGWSHAATQTTWGVGSSGSLKWEQLRFYAPSGDATSEYPQGQPTYVGSVAKDYCIGSFENCGTTMTFQTKTVGTVTVTASDDNTATPDASTTGAVLQDLSPKYGGLGVVSLKDFSVGPIKRTYVSPSNPDQIDSADTLTFKFDKPVQIIGLHLFNADHGLFSNTQAVAEPKSILDWLGWGHTGSGSGTGTSTDAKTFSVLVNDKLYTYDLNSSFPWFGAESPLVGTEFTFVNNGTPFYVGAIKVAAGVPEPQTYALVGLGLVAAGWVARRRKA